MRIIAVMLRSFSLSFIALLLLCCLPGCKHKPHVVNRGFYYWKTTYAPTAFEQHTLQQLKVQTMYIRLFDVDMNQAIRQPYPVAAVRLPAAMDKAFRYVPVIFITQRTLKLLNKDNIPQTAARINNLAYGLCTAAGITPAELQIDCDWTAGTRQTYFSLLTALRKQDFFAGKTLSCTIRMHQIKYTGSSGIPPADKGLLMCYNMGNMKKPGEHNSILETATAKQYLSGIGSYPLPLDIALPIFSWSLLFHGQEFGSILRDVPAALMEQNPLFRKRSATIYECRRDTIWQGHLLRTHDVIRVEESDPETLEEIAAYTAARIKNDSLNIIFFSCDSITLSKYPLHELETVYHHYQ
jgi:hypothetical protein